MPTQWEGVIPPVATPLTSTGEVDFSALDRVVDHLVEAGVHGLFPLGSTGEVAYFTDAQRTEITRRVVKRASGLPVFVGCIDLTAERIVEQGRRAVDSGADALVVTAPLYARNDAHEVMDHFRMISDGVDAPLVAYDIPIRVHYKLLPELLVPLGLEGVLAGVKDSSGDDVNFRRLVAHNSAAGSPLRLFTGHELMVDGMLMLGADGVVPGLANVDPHGYVRLWDLAKAGDWQGARREQDRLLELFEIVFLSPDKSGDASGVGAFKAAMKHIGLIESAKMAPPTAALDEDVVARIHEIVDSVDLSPGHV